MSLHYTIKKYLVKFKYMKFLIFLMNEIVSYWSKYNIPFYSLEKVFCAKYVRLLLRDLFSIDLKPADAWEMRKQTGKIINCENKNFKNCLKNLEEGDVLCFYNPKSKYNIKGRKYTHLVLFYKNEKNKYLFLEQWEGKQEFVNVEKFKERGFVLIEILRFE